MRRRPTRKRRTSVRKRRTKEPRVGDEVCVTWDDHRGYGRTRRRPSSLRFGKFCTWGLVRAITASTLIIASEQDITEDEPLRTHEGTIIGKRMVVTIEVLRRRPRRWRAILEEARSFTK